MSACAMCHYDPAAEVLRAWTLRLKIKAVSHNRIDRGGSGRWAYRKYAGEVLDEVAPLAALLGVPAAMGKRRVTITRLWGKGERAFDRINLAGGLKPVLDSLVKLGLLVDDATKHCEDHYDQHGPHKHPGIEIVIEEVA